MTLEAEDIIDVKRDLRDLGLLMNDQATWKNHVDKVCSQVNQKAGWILRTFRCRTTSFIKQMWKSLIQGHIDYCSQLWQPLKFGELQGIENLQKIFT